MAFHSMASLATEGFFDALEELGPEQSFLPS